MIILQRALDRGFASRPAATARAGVGRERRVSLQHRLGACAEILASDGRIGAALPGDLRLPLSAARTIVTVPAARSVAARAILPIGAGRAFGAILTILRFSAHRPLVPVLPIEALGLLAGADRLTLVAVILIAVGIEVGLLTARLLILEPATLIRDDAEIMVDELEIIFGVHPVALTLGVSGEVLVLLQQLRGVTPRAAVNPVSIVRTALPALARATAPAAIVTTTAATTTGLPIVDQAACPLAKRTWAPGHYPPVRSATGCQSRAAA